MFELKEGNQALDFTLMDKNGQKHKLSNIKSKYVIIYFYPKDNTPGCTIEAISFSKSFDDFTSLGATVIGISSGDEKSKTKFCEKYDLKVLLLSDQDFSVSNKYGVYGEKSFMGKKYMGISRDTFVLNQDHKVLKVFRGVKPADHIAEVLGFLKSLIGGEENGRTKITDR